MCTYRLTGPGESREDGAMNEMTLPSGHMIQTCLKLGVTQTPVVAILHMQYTI